MASALQVQKAPFGREDSRCFRCARQLQQISTVQRWAALLQTGTCHPAPSCIRGTSLRSQPNVCNPWRHVAHAVVAAALMLGNPDPAAAETTSPLTHRPPPVGIAGLFSSQPAIDLDPVDPFTLYGTVFKKFLIEKLDGDRVVARKRGFTTTVCTAALGQAEETPEMQFLPITEKVRLAGNQKCRKAETQDAEDGCVLTCPASCQAAVDSYLASYRVESGYQLDEAAKQKLLASCTRRCNRECAKGGTVYNFVVNFRRY